MGRKCTSSPGLRSKSIFFSGDEGRSLTKTVPGCWAENLKCWYFVKFGSFLKRFSKYGFSHELLPASLRSLERIYMLWYIDVFRRGVRHDIT